MFSEIESVGLIIPKSHLFEITFALDGSILCDGSTTAGPSFQNAVLGHQLNSNKFLTSGISTTPHFDRSKYYALHFSCYKTGRILVFDTDKLPSDEYEFIHVSGWVQQPKEIADSEVILKRKDNESIPLKHVTTVLNIRTS